MERLKKVRDIVFDNWAFFNRGYSTYITFAINLYNFINILILRGYAFLPTTILLLISAIGIVCNIIGRVDFRYGLAPRGTTITAKSTPYNRDLAQAIIYLAEGKKEEAAKILEKWTKPISVK